jgi:WD40 repeat protein
LVSAVTYYANGTRAASVSYDGEIILWNTAHWTPVKRLTGANGMLRNVQVSPDGTKAGVICSDAKTGVGGEVQLWDLTAGQIIGRYPYAPQAVFHDIAFSPDGKWLAGGQTLLAEADDTHPPMQKVVVIWEATTMREVKRLTCPPTLDDYIWRIGFANDSTALWAYSPSGTITTWDIAGGGVTHTTNLPVQNVTRIAVSPQAPVFATGGGGGAVMLWDTSTLYGQAPPTARATLYALAHGDWLAYTPRGYYACSPGAANALAWRIGDVMHPAADFEKDYHRPELLQEAMRGIAK